MFKCKNCQKEYSKWQGKCDSCLEWNTLVEDFDDSTKNRKDLKKLEIVDLDSVSSNFKQKLVTEIYEFDQALGGGITLGQAILLAGSPGIGKSTLLLLIAKQLKTKKDILYIAGEESVEQIKTRAVRLGEDFKNLKFIQNTNIESIENFIVKNHSSFSLILVDSIQTLFSHEVSSPAGSISQVTTSADKLVHLAKGFNIPIIIVGHITKTGNIAGPKTLEHLVDTVLYFEGDKKHEFRILRVEKNRFGPTDLVGLFKMTESGLKEVKDTKELFQPKQAPAIGSVFTVAIEGNRPIVLEVQALCTKSYFEIPRRTTSGFEKARLNIILALLDKILKLKTYAYDVYVNITGGLNIKDPGIDLAVLKAIISSIKNEPVDPKNLYFGEVGLTGEIRKVMFQEKRTKEAKKLGFQKIICSDYVQQIKNLV